MALAQAAEVCADVDNDIARLKCYDNIFPPKRADRGPAAAGPAATAPPPAATAVDAEAEFGLTSDAVRKKKVAEKTAPPALDKLVAHVALVKEQPNGDTVFHLDNGQVWLQTEHSLGFVVKDGEAVTVSKGMLSSYWLRGEGNLSVRVKRLR